MRKKEPKPKSTGKLIVLIVLLTVFFVSFSVSSFIIINANRLVFVEDYENYLAIIEGIESNGSKDQQIVELTEQLERYKEMYSGLAEENKSLINANQSLSSKVSGLESQISKSSSSSSAPEGDEKTDDKEPEEKSSQKEQKDDSRSTSSGRTTSGKTTSTSSKKTESDD